VTARNPTRGNGSALTVRPASLPTREDVVTAHRERLPALRAALEAALEPADLESTRKRAVLLLGSFKVADGLLSNPEIFVRGLTEELAQFPGDVQDNVIRKLRRTCRWLPSIGEVVECCEELMCGRREALRILRIRQRGVRGGRGYFEYVEALAAARKQEARRASKVDDEDELDGRMYTRDRFSPD